MSRAITVPLAAAVALSTLLSGCSAETADQSRSTVLVTTTTTPQSVQGGTDASSRVRPADAGMPPAPAPPPPVPGEPATDLRGAIDRIAAALPAGSGVAVAPVGRPDEVVHVGNWSVGVSWSTVKVPLSIATLRVDPSSAANVEAALTASDNDAAEALWNTLGAGDAAAGAVQSVLREGGDAATVVPSVRLREGFSVFGQTQWSLVDQSRFASALPCVAGAAPVVDAMGRVIPDQRWGLGTIPGARFKGGWGPLDGGNGYLVRQFGLIPTTGGDLAVSVAIDAGSFAEGTQALNGIAATVARELAAVGGGTC